jgi:hypothetical protein
LQKEGAGAGFRAVAFPKGVKRLERRYLGVEASS